MIVGGGSDTVTERLTGTIIIIGFVLYCGTVPSIIMVKEDGVMICRGTQ